LFCKKAKLLVLTDTALRAYSVEARLGPLLAFLSTNLAMIQANLNAKLFVKFVKLLWTRFHQVPDCTFFFLLALLLNQN
jgi:hypothetical protein